MKTNKKVQKNNVQKSEKETAAKVTALAILQTGKRQWFSLSLLNGNFGRTREIECLPERSLH